MLVPRIALVFDRRHTADKKHTGSIELRITLGKTRKFISTGIKCLPNQWKGGNPYVSGYETSQEDNRMLSTIVNKAHRIVSGQLESGEVDIDAIPKLMKFSEAANITFLQYIMQRIEKESKTESEATYRQKVSFYNKLFEYGKIKLFSDISEKAIRDFDEWLHAYKWTENDKYGSPIAKSYSQGTIGSFHKNLKAFIADAKVDGYLKENIYVEKRIKVDKGETRVDEYLTINEVNRLEKAVMPTKSLAEAKDLFLIQVMTGLSYVDLMTFDFLPYKNKPEYTLVKGNRKKTGVEFCFVLTPKAIEILSKYSYRLPKLPNQKYNTKLKLVADAAGIDKAVTSHMGRRSAGSILLNSGVPIEIVSRILAHSSILQTQKAYARILDETVVDVPELDAIPISCLYS